jgi:hypothetical protein
MPIKTRIMDAIRARYFAGQPHVSIGSHEGAHPDADAKTLSFGTRLGPEHDEQGVIHEMGHFVEATELRCIAPSFGMRNTAFILGPYGAVPIFNTPAQAIREARVFAYEWNLQQALGAEWHKDIPDMVKPLTFLSGYLAIPGCSDEERLAWCAARVEELLPEMTVERFDKIWFDRAARLPELFKAREDHYSPTHKGKMTRTRTYGMSGFEDDAERDRLTAKLYTWRHEGRVIYEVLGFVGEVYTEMSAYFTDEEKAIAYLKRGLIQRAVKIDDTGESPANDSERPGAALPLAA